jgi:heme o synthase
MTLASGVRVADYWTLTKPEVNLSIGVTTAAGFCLGSAGQGDGLSITALVHTIVGTLLVASGTGTLNQLLERQFDALMRRTARRPVAAGRIAPWRALVFGVVLAIAGILELAAAVNRLSSVLAFTTMAIYLLVYTPLKRKTPLCTLIGAIPGAAPPLIGWAGATGALSAEAWVLYAMVFLWQFPHFMAIAWMYREDYERAGYFVLPRGEARTRFVMLQTLLPLLGLILVTASFGTPALLLGLAFLFFGLRFVLQMSAATARRLLLASILYLPALLAMEVVFRFLR